MKIQIENYHNFMNPTSFDLLRDVDLKHTFKYLHVYDLVVFQQTSKRWQRILRSSLLPTYFQSHYPELTANHPCPEEQSTILSQLLKTRDFYDYNDVRIERYYSLFKDGKRVPIEFVWDSDEEGIFLFSDNLKAFVEAMHHRQWRVKLRLVVGFRKYRTMKWREIMLKMKSFDKAKVAQAHEEYLVFEAQTQAGKLQYGLDVLGYLSGRNWNQFESGIERNIIDEFLFIENTQESFFKKLFNST